MYDWVIVTSLTRNYRLNRRHYGLLALLLSLAGCTREVVEFNASPVALPENWSFITDYHRCFLKIDMPRRPVFRVNCFQIDGELYTHSNRLVELSSWFLENTLLGTSWVNVVVKKPDLLVAIDGKVYAMRIKPVKDEQMRLQILKNRNYDPVPKTIRVFKLISRHPVDV